MQVRTCSAKPAAREEQALGLSTVHHSSPHFLPAVRREGCRQRAAHEDEYKWIFVRSRLRPHTRSAWSATNAMGASRPVSRGCQAGRVRTTRAERVSMSTCAYTQTTNNANATTWRRRVMIAAQQVFAIANSCTVERSSPSMTTPSDDTLSARRREGGMAGQTPHIARAASSSSQLTSAGPCVRAEQLTSRGGRLHHWAALALAAIIVTRSR